MAVLKTTSPVLEPMAPKENPSNWVVSDKISRAFIVKNA
jgi:hypothetical protein